MFSYRFIRMINLLLFTSVVVYITEFSFYEYRVYHTVHY